MIRQNGTSQAQAVACTVLLEVGAQPVAFAYELVRDHRF